MNNEFVCHAHFIVENYKKYKELNFVFDAYALAHFIFICKTHPLENESFMESLCFNLQRMKQYNIKTYVDVGAADEIRDLSGLIKFFDITQNDKLCVKEIIDLFSRSINVKFDSYISGVKDIKIKNETCKTIYIADTRGLFDFIKISNKVLAGFSEK